MAAAKRLEPSSCLTLPLTCWIIEEVICLNNYDPHHDPHHLFQRVSAQRWRRWINVLPCIKLASLSKEADPNLGNFFKRNHPAYSSMAFLNCKFRASWGLTHSVRISSAGPDTDSSVPSHWEISYSLFVFYAIQFFCNSNIPLFRYSIILYSSFYRFLI